MAEFSWGLIGGGEGSQIGPAHRLAARLDGLFDFVAGALDIEPERGRRFALSLGVPADRAYGDWREMLEHEKSRADRLDLVTIATPNATHYEIARAFLGAGFDLLIEKPMTMTVEEARDIVEIARTSGRICAVAVGRMHGLTLQVFGNRGGLRWAQEWPNQLYWTPLNGPTQILERGAQGLSADAERASRIAAGHAEGLPAAFANIYADLAEVLSARSEEREPDPASTLYPGAGDGLISVAAVTAAVRSAANESAWTTISPWD